MAESGVNEPLICGSSSIGSAGRVSVKWVTRATQLTHDVNHLVALRAVICREVVRDTARTVRNLAALGGVEEVCHALVEGEEGGRFADPGTRAADGGRSDRGE